MRVVQIMEQYSNFNFSFENKQNKLEKKVEENA
jgi:hypothetical protein